MLRHPLFYTQLVVLILVAVLHSAGVYASLYWIWQPFDLITHFLGGAWVSLVALWIVFFSDLTPLSLRRFSMVAVALVAVFVVGLLWELFEFFVEVPKGVAYYQDTALDLIMDVLGALSAWWFVKTKEYGT